MPITTSDSTAPSRSRRVRSIARLLDSAIPLPGGFRIGLDGIIGLIPGVGDFVTTTFASYIVYHAWTLGVPRSVLLRMATNVVIDTLFGAIPLIGDLFDFVFKANQRNLALMERYESQPVVTRRRSRLIVFGILVVVVALIVLLGFLAWWLVSALLEALAAA